MNIKNGQNYLMKAVNLLFQVPLIQLWQLHLFAQRVHPNSFLEQEHEPLQPEINIHC